LYSPEDFGAVAIYLLGISLLTTLATGKYEDAVYLPNNSKGVAQVVDLSSKLSILFSIILLLLVLLVGDYFWVFFDMKNSIIWLYVLPIAVFISSQYVLLTQLAIKRSEYMKLSKSRVFQSFVNGGVAISLADIILNFGLLFSNLIGQIIAFLTISKIKRMVCGKYKFSNMGRIAVAKKYAKFPLFLVPSGLLNVISGNMPTIILTSAFGLSYVGFYNLVQKTLSGPSAFIGNSFAEVFRQQASDDIKTHGTCRPLFSKTVMKLTLISIIPFSILMIYTPQVFEIIFGKDWRIAGEMAQILVPMFFIRFVTMPVAPIILLRDRAEIDFFWQLTFLGLSLIGFLFTDTINYMMVYFSVSYSFMYLLSLLINFKLAKL
jgi:O-antigen/teichoic acid export membrane protein